MRGGGPVPAAALGVTAQLARARIDSPPARPSAISSRSANVKHRPFRLRPRRGRTPPLAITHRVPCLRYVPAACAASVMNSPRCSAAQNTCTFLADHVIKEPGHQHPHSNRCCDDCKNRRFVDRGLRLRDPWLAVNRSFVADGAVRWFRGFVADEEYFAAAQSPVLETGAGGLALTRSQFGGLGMSQGINVRHRPIAGPGRARRDRSGRQRRSRRRQLRDHRAFPCVWPWGGGGWRGATGPASVSASPERGSVVAAEAT